MPENARFGVEPGQVPPIPAETRIRALAFTALAPTTRTKLLTSKTTTRRKDGLLSAVTAPMTSVRTSGSQEAP